MASAATKLLETAKQAVKGECAHSFAYEGPRCPCCAETVLINAGTSNVRLLHGQRIFFCDEACKSRFVADPNTYFATEGEHTARQAAGTQPHGDWLDKKDYDNFRVWCPGCNTSLHVDGATPRLHLVNGQTLFFRCYECVVNFLTKPARFFAHCGECSEFKTKEQGTTPQQVPSEQMQGLSISNQMHGQKLPAKSPACTTCQGGRLCKQDEVCPQCQCPPVQGSTAPTEHKAEGLKEGISNLLSGKHHGEQAEHHEWSEVKLERCQRKHHHSFKPTEKATKQEGEDKALCPGCAMQVHFAQKSGTEIFVEFLGGQRIFFCSEPCRAALADDPMRSLKSSGSFREPEPEFLNLEGFIMICPTCQGSRMTLTTATPRIFFKHGQSLFFCKHDCLESFCHSSKSYLHTCPRVHKARKQAEEQYYGQRVSAPASEQTYSQQQPYQGQSAITQPSIQTPQMHHYTTAMPVSGTQKVPLQQYPQPAPIQQETIQSMPAQTPAEHHGGGGLLSNIGQKLGLTGDHDTPTETIRPAERELPQYGGVAPGPSLGEHSQLPTQGKGQYQS